MRNDIKTNILLSVGVVCATITPSTVNSASVDHSKAGSASFILNVGALTGTVDAKVQYSDDDSAWTDEDGANGNDTAITQLVAGSESAQLNVVNPQGRYSRVVVTVGGTSAVMGVTNALGPLRTVKATDL